MSSQVKAKPQASVHALGRNIVTVASGKGGVGKTWFAISLAQALTKAGKRVLLFDGDLGLANIDVQLGVMPDQDLATVVSGKITLFEAVTKVESTGFDLIGGRSGSGALARLNQTALEDLQRNLIGVGQHYDLVVLDLGAGVDTGVTTLDVAKAMIDEGLHPMTMYFPLVVHGALLVEPTESETRESLDQLIAVLRGLAEQAKSGDAARFHEAPQYAPRRRFDETTAARHPVLRWQSGS